MEIKNKKDIFKFYKESVISSFPSLTAFLMPFDTLPFLTPFSTPFPIASLPVTSSTIPPAALAKPFFNFLAKPNLLNLLIVIDIR